MLKIDKKYVESILAVAKLTHKKSAQIRNDKLIETLHQAMRLEASTIPPYYVAAWSIKDSDSKSFENEKIRTLIASIAKEEMLHMMSISNMIAATGVIPDIYSKEMVLDWGKDSLPIGSNLVPTLAPFSMEILGDLFMEIEQPISPIHYVVKRQMVKALAVEEHYATIGEFYDALKALILSFPEDPFKNGANYKQIKLNYDPRMTSIGHAPITDFQITNKEQAFEILDWIIDQGEGSTSNPLDGNDAPAHYYRFAEIYKGGELVKDASQKLGYAYDQKNHPIMCDFSKVYQFAPNPKMKDFDPNSRQYKGLMKFNKLYKDMFFQLQEFYKTGNEQFVKTAISSMNNMNGFAIQLLESSPSVCPSFEWVEDSKTVFSANVTKG